jgi:fused signal recognition particle receptor
VAEGGFLSRLRKRLNAGAGWLGQLVPGRRIDADTLDELETRLLTADVGVEAANTILEDLRKRVARNELADRDALLAALVQSIARILAPVEKPLSVDPARQPFVILVVGVNGSGKTTSIGKLAHRLKGEGRSILLAAGDTFRAAAIEQLTTWAERNAVPIIAQQSGADPAAVIFDAMQAARARRVDVLIADTAGRLHNQAHLMEELKKVKRVMQRLDPSAPHEVLLVLDAGTGQNALAQAAQFHEALGVTGIVLTKLDGSAKGGIVLAIAKRLALPIRFIGLGEQIDDFGVFEASAFADALVRGPDAQAPGAAPQ